MGLHTKNLDSIIDKLIPKEVLPTILSNSMENEIKKLIEKWENRREGVFSEAAYLVLEDFESLLKFKQKNCCGKVVENEITKDKTERECR